MGSFWKYAAAGVGGFVLGFGAGYVTREAQMEAELAEAAAKAKGTTTVGK